MYVSLIVKTNINLDLFILFVACVQCALYATHPLSSNILPCASQEINRELVLERLPEIMPSLESQVDDKLYESVMFEIIDLPSVDRSKHLGQVYKISFDEVLSVLMEYYDMENTVSEAVRKLKRETMTARVSSIV